jgi:hypothetical protein
MVLDVLQSCDMYTKTKKTLWLISNFMDYIFDLLSVLCSSVSSV